METRYGFVYIWRDRKHKRYYIGSHWGLETDKYKCSSPWMLNSWKRRPQDFKRRILERHDEIAYRELRDREHCWLDMIKEEELGVRYYNLHKTRNHWMACDNSKNIKEKISAGLRKHASGLTPEQKQQRFANWHGKTQSVESNKKRSETLKAKFRSGELKPTTLIGENNGFYGKKHTEETKMKNRLAHMGKK